MAQKSYDNIRFKVNGEAHEISDNVDMRDSLNDYIRDNLNLKGTKFMCREGGCGLCIVNVKEKHPITNESVSYAVNSCLVSPFSCHGKDITTIEGLGNRSRGYHPIQKRLSSFNGSQCGYCSPGWVMSMYSALETEGKNLTMDKVENYFGSNLCRCTGYRPILDAMKSFASDANLKMKQQISDIEDIDKLNLCKKTGNACTTTCEDFHLEEEYCIIDALEITKKSIYNKRIEISHLERKWFKVYSLQQLFEIFENEGTDSYELLAGNTARGIYRTILPKILIDISHIDELRNYSIGTNLTLGANMTLTEAMNIFNELSNSNFYFLYTKILADHLSLVAHYPVRNIGTIAGNLSIKHKHPEFSSDLFLLLETIGAAVDISDQRRKITVNLLDYLKIDMKGKVIINIHLPPMASNHIFKTYKITPRAQNAHAIINAGFLITLRTDGCIKSAKIVYGNISKTFTHAINTEKILTGKIFYKDETVRLAIQMLDQEIYPTFEYSEPSVEYRKKLALALFYKFCLSVLPPTLIDQKYISGGSMINRSLSSGKQIFDTNRTNYPLNEPITKLEADNQCTGEAKYVNDIHKIPGELRATFVTSTIHRGILVNIDATEALKISSVKAVLTASDIPGANTFTPLSVPATTTEEEVLVEVGKMVKFYGQPIAIIVADNEHALTEAASLVKITYKEVTAKPILTIQEALAVDPKENRIVNNMVTERTKRGKHVKRVLKGSFDVKSQYHFHTENQTCVCVPIEDGMNVFASTQWMDQVNVAIAGLLNMHENSINVIVRRLGGGFGAKVSRSTQIACACALAAWKLNKPVRFVMSLEMNMTSVGKKHSTFANYEVGVDENGKIQYLDNTFYHDNGCSLNETLSVQFLLPAFPNCYDSSTWTISANSVLTDTPSTTFFRAPGSCEAIGMIENIMDHIAFETGIDSIKVRLANMPSDMPVPEMIEQHTEETDYYKRLGEVDEFNSNNRWKKKGISLTAMTFRLEYIQQYSSVISIYHTDGTVAVTHSGIEMGQGINTKVAQVVAYAFDIPIQFVAVKPSSNHVTPNAFTTAGSMTSDLCCYSTLKTCEILNERMKDVKNKMNNSNWPELIAAAYTAGVNLHASYMYSPNVDPIKSYLIYGVCISEVEVDMLTGNHIITRVDILEDVGDSLSPLIDVGQVEGAFMMGVGYWTIENLKYNPNTGELLTNRTWNYKVPGAKDIPVDFRVYFRRSAPNTLGVLRAKATGEPPLTLSFSVAAALRHALTSARKDAGLNPNEWFILKYPLTSENILLASGTDAKDFTLKKVSTTRRSRKIHVQPTSIARRKERGLPCSGRIQSGRPTKTETVKRNRVHNIASNIDDNEPPAKKH